MLLVMSLVLTLVLSSVSRSVTDVGISTSEDSSIRAFDAAQAGIERMVIQEATPGAQYQLGNNASYTVNTGVAQGTGNFYKYPLNLMSGESAIFSFVDYDVVDGDYVPVCNGGGSCQIPNNIRICWGSPDTPTSSDTTPALFMEFYYNSDPDVAHAQKWENMFDLSDIKVATISADPYAGRSPPNHFTPLFMDASDNCNPNNASWAFNSAYSIRSNDNLFPGFPGGFDVHYNGALLFVRITMLYNDIPQPLGMKSASPLPIQGSAISSVGQSGDTFRKLILFQGYPEIPVEFGNSLFSKSDLTK